MVEPIDFQNFKKKHEERKAAQNELEEKYRDAHTPLPDGVTLNSGFDDAELIKAAEHFPGADLEDQGMPDSIILKDEFGDPDKPGGGVA